MKIPRSFFSRCRQNGLCQLVILLVTLASLDAAKAVDEGSSAGSTGLTEWPEGRYATGPWFGARDQLADWGVSPFGSWKGTFYGLTGGGLDSPRGAFDEEITLGLKLDFERMAGIRGLTALGSVRWRDGRNPNDYVGASSTFQPSRYQSGVQWRLMPFYITYTTPELFGVERFLTISGGWQNAYDFFLDQPESKLFTNSAVGTSKGIGGVNGMPWSSSYAAWGGQIRIDPALWYYAKAGLYMAIPEAANTGNHGLYFEGFGPDPERNGLYFIGETGVTPELGSDKLPGKYAFGGLYWGLENRSFFGEVYDQKFDFYWQADQMLYRETVPDEPTVAAKEDVSEGVNAAAPGAKSFMGKDPLDSEPAKLSKQGLYGFSVFNLSPKYNNAMPFYFHLGLVYKGLIPARDDDQLGVAFALGNYSYYKILAEEDRGQSVHQTNEALVEMDYRIQLTRFTYLQPFWQYIVRPSGTGLIGNANILGLHMAVTF